MVDSVPWRKQAAESGFGIQVRVGVRKSVDQNGSSKTGMVIHTCNLSIQEAEAGGCRALVEIFFFSKKKNA